MSPIVPGELAVVSALVQRLTAPNPGVMTGPGTNAYLVGTQALALIDPGPAIESHIDALLQAVGTRLRWILCTHTHLDHSPAAAAICAATRAQVIGKRPPDDGRHDPTFAPDRVMEDGERLQTPEFTLRAVHTPGHSSEHLCYLLEEERLLFTGDHVMQGSTVVIGPPDGSMSAYLASLEKLFALDVTHFAPGHGHVIDNPQDEVRRLIRHRLGRERKVLEALTALGRADLERLVVRAYDDVSAKLHPVAMRSLLAHLQKLEQDGRARCESGQWAALAGAGLSA
jgi:glyoxylase-like metal-dependent hydrolase (beta-lactamase superfamily II)